MEDQSTRMVWRPIDTAPKDEEILLFVPPNEIEIGFYWLDGRWMDLSTNYSFEPTHWMPLPEKPKVTPDL
jgi:hypothetical protein